MKKIIKFIFGTVLSSFFLITFFLVGFVGFSQTTPIPDPNFERKLIAFGIDSGTVNGRVLTANISSVTFLDVSNFSTLDSDKISDLTGIEAFTSLSQLRCHSNQLTSLDVSANKALTSLTCAYNLLTNLDVFKNTALTQLHCGGNQLTSLDVSKNTALTQLLCNDNELTDLDVSANTALLWLSCHNNQLTSLNMQNISLVIFFSAHNNPNLRCIQVDDVSLAESFLKFNKDATASNEDFEITGFSISPNPTTGILNITVVEKTEYKLLNIRGQTLKTGVLEIGKSKINLLPFTKGIYFLNLKTSRWSFTEKIVRN